jgi:hypothetical protein
MAEVAISTEGLVKRYGRNRGLAGLDLEVQRGEVYGFLGPNGARKITTIRLLLALPPPAVAAAPARACGRHRRAHSSHQGTGTVRRPGPSSGGLGRHPAPLDAGVRIPAASTSRGGPGGSPPTARQRRGSAVTATAAILP